MAGELLIHKPMMTLIPSFIRDVRHAARMLWRVPIFTATVIAVIALGIGASTAIFSVINRVLLEPLPYPEPDRLVRLVTDSPMGQSLMASVPKFNVWREGRLTFQFMAAYDSPSSVRLTGGELPEQLLAQHVSADYFPLFGFRATRGRVFGSDEDRPRGPHVAVVSYRLWVRRFKSDLGLVGRGLVIEGTLYEVIGVLDEKDVASADLWLPLQADPESSDHASRIQVAGRLAAGVTLDQGRRQMNGLAGEFHRRFPRAMGPLEHATVVPLRDVLVGDVRSALWMLSGAVAIVLVIVCANVASLQMAHAIRRSREIATRTALGASRGRLIGQLLTESVLMSLGGGVFGIALGHFSIGALLALYPGAMPLAGQSVGLDSRVLEFSLLTTAMTGLACGLLPALSASRVDLSAAFKEGNAQPGSGPAQGHLRSVLVIGEIAMALVLLVATGLLIRTYSTMHHNDRGFDANHVLTLEMPVGGLDKTAAVDQLIRNAERRMKTVPGVIDMATTISLPLESSLVLPFTIEGVPLMSAFHGLAQWRSISPRYFDVFHIRLMRGRSFTDRDNGPAPPVVLINETMARKYWPGGNPVGRRLVLGKNVRAELEDPRREIIGVIADVRDKGLSRIAEPTAYVPASQVPDNLTALNNHRVPITWVIRTAGEPERLRSEIARVLVAASGGLPIGRIRSMDQVVAESTARIKFNMILLTIFSGIALSLAAVGLYGLMSYSVEQRRQEIGIRMAIGARPEDVRNMFVRQGLRLALAGIIVGLGVAYGLTRLMGALIWGVDGSDPTVSIFVAMLLCGITLLAAYLPARRILRMDPSVVLRH